jgi:THAP4-like, heme-binding beta-barrel domain
VTQPVPDTTDLRTGPPLPDALLAVLPLVGTWLGSGSGVLARTGETFSFGQQLSFGHDGRPFLVYESRAWLLAEDGSVLRSAWRESGFWRCAPGADELEVVLASNTGQSLTYLGRSGDQRWEIATASVVGTPSAVAVDGERRLYAVVDATLHYATDLAPAGQPYAPHLNARLTRQ